MTCRQNPKIIEYLRANKHEGGASGFILPDGEWVPIRRQSHNNIVVAALHHAGEPTQWDMLGQFRDTYGIIRVTYHPGMIAFDVPDGVTARQVEAAALRVIATTNDTDIIGWHREPGRESKGPRAEERERCLAKLEKLAGRSRYRVRSRRP